MSTADNTKVAGLRPATSEKNENCVVSLLNPHGTTAFYNCQTAFDDTLTLTEALEFSDWDTTAWVESQVMGGFMSPSWAREYHGYCPQWLAEFARERYSMAAAGY